MPSPRKASNTGTVSSSLLLAAAPSLLNNFKCFQPEAGKITTCRDASEAERITQCRDTSEAGKSITNAGMPLKQEKCNPHAGLQT